MKAKEQWTASLRKRMRLLEALSGLPVGLAGGIVGETEGACIRGFMDDQLPRPPRDDKLRSARGDVPSRACRGIVGLVTSGRAGPLGAVGGFAKQRDQSGGTLRAAGSREEVILMGVEPRVNRLDATAHAPGRSSEGPLTCFAQLGKKRARRLWARYFVSTSTKNWSWGRPGTWRIVRASAGELCGISRGWRTALGSMLQIDHPGDRGSLRGPRAVCATARTRLEGDRLIGSRGRCPRSQSKGAGSSSIGGISSVSLSTKTWGG